jgi:hypothetical protein
LKFPREAPFCSVDALHGVRRTKNKAMRSWMVGLVSLPLVSLAACAAPVGLGSQPGEGEGSSDASSTAQASDAGGCAPVSTGSRADASAPGSGSSGSGGTTVTSVSGTSDASAPADASVAPLDASVDAGAVNPPPAFGTTSISPAAPLQITHDVVVDGLPSDRFTWRDSQDESRSAVLAHNDGTSGAGGSQGGELRELDYVTRSGTTRTAHAPPTSFGGFGYVVAHRSEGTDGISADDSPLGHFFPGTWTRLFEGRNHAIFRFTQSYPRYAMTTAAAPNKRYDVPVTIDWVFSSGHDDPLWAVTWDLSAVPANAVESDSRAPYGEMLFDGSADLDSHSVIAGVGWGDRYKFTTTGNAGVTFNSSWTWDTPNTVPYAEIWTQTIDAAMGIVQTQTLAQHDAGGYWGIDRWGTTSAQGNACSTSNGGDLDSLMPCDFNWPFQTIQYAFNDPSTPTNDPRLAWGAEFGFLGQTAYQANGSSWYGGPDGSHTASGWPKQSYSTYIALGEKSADPVGSSVGGVEAVQTVTTSATIGTVATGGPAGINRTDTMTYAPAGYDPVYGALTYTGQSNVLDATISVGSGTLAKPLVIVRNWTAGTPAILTLDGKTLTPDTDAYVSVRTDAQELWITLNSNLSGAAHRLQLSGNALAD